MPPRQSRSLDKPRNFAATSKRMIKELSKEKFLVFFIMFLSILSALLTIFSPIVLQDIINSSIPQEGSMNSALFEITINSTDATIYNVLVHWDYFFLRFSTMIIFYVASALLSFLAEFLTVSISARYAKNMRQQIQRKFEKLPLSYFDKVPYGDTLSIGTNDVDNISKNLQSIIVQTCNSITLFLGTLIAMLVTKWQLALVALCSLPFTILIVLCVSKFSQKQFILYRSELGDLNGKVEENYAGFLIIKLFNKQKESIDDFNKINEKMSNSDKYSQFLSGFIFPTTNFINNLAYVGIAVIGGILQDPGSMIMFFLFLNLFSRPFQQLGQIINIIQSVVASGERIYKLLDEEEFSPDPVTAVSTEDNILGNFAFENVNFSYVPEKELIKNFNLKVHAGDTVAIVGPTGAGKTTLVNLIMRFYEINSGSISLDSIDIKNYRRNTLRGSVGMVLQDTWLFRGTIKENLLYGDSSATQEEIEQACKEAHIHHFIQTLPGQYDFILNEDGTNISQGQRQLLTIARAIISKPKIMILDEATSNVDTRTEQQIQDALDHIMKDKTSFIIAHRLSTIKNAKLIIVMKNGNIIETGNHKELLAKNGFYADLYNSQFNAKNLLEKDALDS